MKKMKEYFDNEYGCNIERPDWEEEFLEERGLTRSQQIANKVDFFGEYAIGNCPAPMIFDHFSQYDREGRHHTFVTQPYKGTGWLTDELVFELNLWSEANNLTVRIDKQDSWYNPGQCYFIEFNRLN